MSSFDVPYLNHRNKGFHTLSWALDNNIWGGALQISQLSVILPGWVFLSYVMPFISLRIFVLMHYFPLGLFSTNYFKIFNSWLGLTSTVSLANVRVLLLKTQSLDLLYCELWSLLFNLTDLSNFLMLTDKQVKQAVKVVVVIGLFWIVAQGKKYICIVFFFFEIHK